jgi:hypothetical protein
MTRDVEPLMLCGAQLRHHSLGVKAVLMSVKESMVIMLLLMLFVHSMTWGRV